MKALSKVNQAKFVVNEVQKRLSLEDVTIDFTDINNCYCDFENRTVAVATDAWGDMTTDYIKHGMRIRDILFCTDLYHRTLSTMIFDVSHELVHLKRDDLGLIDFDRYFMEEEAGNLDPNPEVSYYTMHEGIQANGFASSIVRNCSKFFTYKSRRIANVI